MWRMNQNIGYQQYVWMEEEEEMVRLFLNENEL
jgi:hypothetical protein